MVIMRARNFFLKTLENPQAADFVPFLITGKFFAYVLK